MEDREEIGTGFHSGLSETQTSEAYLLFSFLKLFQILSELLLGKSPTILLSLSHSPAHVRLCALGSSRLGEGGPGGVRSRQQAAAWSHGTGENVPSAPKHCFPSPLFLL